MYLDMLPRRTQRRFHRRQHPVNHRHQIVLPACERALLANLRTGRNDVNQRLPLAGQPFTAPGVNQVGCVKNDNLVTGVEQRFDHVARNCPYHRLAFRLESFTVQRQPNRIGTDDGMSLRPCPRALTASWQSDSQPQLIRVHTISLPRPYRLVEGEVQTHEQQDQTPIVLLRCTDADAVVAVTCPYRQ